MCRSASSTPHLMSSMVDEITRTLLAELRQFVSEVNEAVPGSLQRRIDECLALLTSPALVTVTAKRYTVRLVDVRPGKGVLQSPGKLHRTIRTAINSAKHHRGWKAGGLGGLKPHIQVHVLDETGELVERLVWLDVTTIELVNSPLGLLDSMNIRRRDLHLVRINEELSRQLVGGGPV